MPTGTDLPSDIGARIRQAKGRIKTIPGVGTFVLQEENTWAAHALLVKDVHNGIEFSPPRCPVFDATLNSILNIPSLTDPSFSLHARYEGLRTNFAVIRNYLLYHYHASGAFDTSPEAMGPLLTSIASALAETLTSQKQQGIKTISRSLNIDIANIEGLGAAKMYAYLAEIQDKPGLWQPLMKNMKSLFSKAPARAWNLPALEESPFSVAGLAAPPPNYIEKTLPDAKPKTKPSDPNADERVKEAMAMAAAPSAITPPSGEDLKALDDMIEASEAIMDTVKKMSVDALEDPTKEESVEEARKILRWLRNMEFTDRDLEEFLDQGTPQTVVSKKQAVQKLVRIIAVQLQVAQRRNADLARDTAVENARNALEAMALTVAEHTRNSLSDHHRKLQQLDEEIAELPESALMRQSQPVVRLLDTIEMGMERATGKEVSDLSAASRLQLISERVQSAAFELEEPAKNTPTREESLDLVRDMLNKLKRHPLAGQTVEDLINNSTATQKAEFAQQVGELVESYKNLVAEASMNNPNILDDPKLKATTVAIQQFSYAISLMAAKEIPSSAAATQQIGADVTQMPEEWGQMHNRTVDRLAKHAEGGLEKLLDDLAMDQDDQQEDLMKEAIDAALTESDQGKRKKKKKKRCDSKKRTGKGGKKQRKQQMDMTADDYLLGQGRFAEEAREARAPRKDKEKSEKVEMEFRAINPVMIPGISAEDLETIRQLGNALRQVGSQLRSATSQPATGTSNNRGTSQRPTEQQQQQQPQPRGPSGPRV